MPSASARSYALAVVLGLLWACQEDEPPGPADGGDERVRIGSDNFYESRLMAELYAQVLERAGYTVERSLGLGSRRERAAALEQGQVDMAPEYVGSGLGYYDVSQVTGDGATNRTRLAAVLADKEISVLAITPGEDTNALVVLRATAADFGLSKMSDLAPVQDDLSWGLPPDCDLNPLCKAALVQYGIRYPPARRETFSACDEPMADALFYGDIDVGWLCSTQPAIAEHDLLILEDDLQTQPAENIAPLVRDDYLAGLDDRAGFQALLDAASAGMTTAELTALGVAVVIEQRDIDDVVHDWLAGEGAPAP